LKGDKLFVSLFLISLLTNIKRKKKDYRLPPLLDCVIQTAVADVDVYFLLQGIVDVGRFASTAAVPSRPKK
jgi:hypothetical protein